MLVALKNQSNANMDENQFKLHQNTQNMFECRKICYTMREKYMK